MYLIEEAVKSAPIDAEQLTLLVDAAGLNPRALPIQAVLNLTALLSTCYSQYLGEGPTASRHSKHFALHFRASCLGLACAGMAIVASCGVSAALFWKTLEVGHLWARFSQLDGLLSFAWLHLLVCTLVCMHALFFQPFLSPETRAKVYFLPHDVPTARAFLLQFFEWKSLPAWITQRLTSHSEPHARPRAGEAQVPAS